MKEDISNAFLDFVTCSNREQDTMSASMMRRQLSSESPLGIHRSALFARRSGSMRLPSLQERNSSNNDNMIAGVDAEESSNHEAVGSAKDVEPALEPDIVKYYTSVMETGQIRHPPGDDDDILEKAVPPKDAA
jgi:hypothetical protein